MRLPLTCMACFREDGVPGAIREVVEVRDDSRYQLKCDRGHESVTVLQEQKFEVLFEIGCYAIVDGYFREAISSFSSSLERFYEFSIRVLARFMKVSEANFEVAWKQVQKQSERQLGAFCMIWLSHFGESPKLLEEKQVAFRNRVIHQGTIPTRAEAISFGEEILGVIRPKLNAIRLKFPDEVQGVIHAHLVSAMWTGAEQRSDRLTVSTLSFPTLISLSRNASDNPSLQAYLAGLRRR